MATITAASASYADVNTAVGSAVDGDVVEVPAGSATWSANLNLGAKAIQLTGAGIASTIITNGVGNLIKSSGTGNNPVRISGFTFENSDNQNPIISFSGPSFAVRVDHCYFNKGDSAVGTNFPGFAGSGQVWGVVDHCTFQNMKRPYFATDVRTTGDATNWGATAWTEFLGNETDYPGTARMMYFEDNTILWDAGMTDLSGQGAVYGGYGGKCCFRYNTVTGTDYSIDAHGDSPDYGTIYYEIYNNTFTYGTFNGIQGFAHWQRGGQWIVHDNTITGYPNLINWYMSVYWETDLDAHRVNNTYYWANVTNGNSTQGDIVGIRDSGQTSIGYSAANIILDTDYFLDSPQIGQTYYPYTPYTYPHPLQSGELPESGDDPVIIAGVPIY